MTLILGSIQHFEDGLHVWLLAPFFVVYSSIEHLQWLASPHHSMLFQA